MVRLLTTQLPSTVRARIVLFQGAVSVIMEQLLPASPLAAMVGIVNAVPVKRAPVTRQRPFRAPLDLVPTGARG
jgi:hypothetical protein